MDYITMNKILNPGRRHRTCPLAIKRGLHNAYRVKRPGDKNIRHDGPATIRLANPVNPRQQHDQLKLNGIAL